MNVRLNSIIARHRTAELQHAGEQARLARGVSMSGRKLRHRNVITRLKARPARVLGALIVPAMLAALVFGAPAAMGDPVGQISEFSVGPNTMPGPAYIAPWADGNLWFRCTAPTRSDRHHRACTRSVMLRGTTVITGGAGTDAFTFTGKTDGRALVPGSYRLLATPTADGIAGQRQQTTFELKR